MTSRDGSAGKTPLWVWGLCAGLVLGIAAMLAPRFIRVPRPAGLVDAEDLADEDSRFVDVEGVRIHYKEAGPADASRTLLFLHGWASSLYAWRHVMARLSDRYRVIAFDRPGFGLSSRPLSGSREGADNPYAMLSSAKQTLALMDTLEVDRAVLVGHSQGSAVSMLVDELAPERVAGIVALNTPSASTRFRPLGVSRALTVLRANPLVGALAPLLPRPFFDRRLARAVYGLAYHDPKRLEDESVELELRAHRVKDWDLAYVEFTPLHMALQLPESVLAGVTAPTVVIAGRNDRTVPYRDQVRAAALIPGARLVTFEQTGHVSHEERPQAVADVIEELLGELT